MRALAFPLRLQESGLLERQERTASVLDLLHVMARTPAGSWPGSPNFGLRDLFESRDGSGDIPRISMSRINESFKDLGLDDFVVTAVQKEVSPQSGVDHYAITLRWTAGDEILTATIADTSA